MNNLDSYILFLRTEKKLSNASISSYKLDIEDFKCFLKKDLIETKKEDIINYINHLRDIMKPKSINRHISSLKGFFNYLVEESIILESPLESISVLKVPKSLPKYLSIEEVDKLLTFPLKTPFDYRNKAMLEVVYATGLRVSS